MTEGGLLCKTTTEKNQVISNSKFIIVSKRVNQDLKNIPVTDLHFLPSRLGYTFFTPSTSPTSTIRKANKPFLCPQLVGIDKTAADSRRFWLQLSIVDFWQITYVVG